MRIQRRLTSNISKKKRTEQMIIDIYIYIKKLSPISSTEILKYMYPYNYKNKSHRNIKDKLECLEQLNLIIVEKKEKFYSEKANNRTIKYYEYVYNSI